MRMENEVEIKVKKKNMKALLRFRMARGIWLKSRLPFSYWSLLLVLEVEAEEEEALWLGL